MGPGQSPVGIKWQSSRKLQECNALKLLTFDQNTSCTTCNETNSTYFLKNLQISSNSSSKYNLQQSYVCLTCEHPAYLQIMYQYVYFLKYTELKRFFEHLVCEPKLVYELLNPSGYIFAKIKTSKQIAYIFAKIKTSKQIATPTVTRVSLL